MPGQEFVLAGWLRELGLERYTHAFADAELTPEILPELTDADLRELGLPLGPRKAVLKAIHEMAGPLAAPAAMADAAAADGRPDTAAGAPDAERRQLTVMFADLADSTALSRRLDPEEMSDVLQAYQAVVVREVARFEGHVAKFMGDGVLVYFGWPSAHEDEAERSVRAGLAVVEAVGRLTSPAGGPLLARVRISTGLVVVGGQAGEGSAREQTVVGETPNLAARLQAVAQPGGVVIAASTRRLLGAGFEVEDLGPHPLKGFADGMQAWRVLRERAVGSRFEARAAGLASLLGREHEVALLLDRWQQASDGDGQLVLLSGQPGIGKSRIASVLIERLAGATHALLCHQCSPYYMDTALHPSIELLERGAGFQRDDTPDCKLDKLEALLAQGTDQVGEAAPLICTLLSIATEGRYAPLDSSPQRQKERTIDALVEQVAGLARARPVLCLFEDLHWADPTTLELLDQLVGRISGERVLLLLTFRPEFSPPWRGRPHATQIALNRLPRRQSGALAQAVANGRPLPDSVLHQIVARADGVPLFVEELTKAVLEVAGDTPEPASDRDGSAGLSTPTIPATLQDSLMARLDRLAGAKELAQIGAAIGREFGYELLAAVSLREEGELRGALEQLVASELVFVRGAPPAATYTFKHALVQDAAHASLLKSRRQQLHARIARELEERWPETRRTRPELLAHHFAEAGACDKAAAYGFEAGRAAFGRSAVAEAVVHLQRALGLLKALPEDDGRRRLELDLQITLGHALIRDRGYGVAEVGEAFARARRLAAAADTAQQISLLSGIGAYHYLRSESRALLRVGRDMVRLSRGGDPAAYVEGQRRIGGAYQQLGRLVSAQRHFERGLARFAATQDPLRGSAFTVEPHSVLLALLSCNLLLLGYPDRARARRAEAIKRTRRAAHPLTLASTLHWSAMSALHLGERASLRGWVEELVALTGEHTLANFTQWAQIWQGWLATEAGDSREGSARLRQVLSSVRATGALFCLPFYTALVADLHRRAGDVDCALEVLGEALEHVERTDERVYEADLHRLKGQILLARAPPSTGEAETCLRRALSVARAQKARLWELRAATDLARLWQANGQSREARALLEPVYAWFTEGFDTPDLAEAARLLGTCDSRMQPTLESRA